MNQKRMEQFFDYFDSIADLLYRRYKIPYLEGMNEAFRILLDGKTLKTYDDDIYEQCLMKKETIGNLEFEREEIRKAAQLGVLRAYKHTYTSNAEMTPETIGIFIAYLIQRFSFGKPIKRMLDPLSGTGNLLYTIANQLDHDPVIHGVDIDRTKCELSRNLGDLMEYENQMFHQETTTFYLVGYDVVVMDPSITNEKPYPPLLFLNHHINNLKDGGYLYAVIEHDFFIRLGSKTLHQEITKKAQVIGLIALPENLFQSHPKSILILRKSQRQIGDALMVKLSSFRDKVRMEEILHRINQWIEQRKDDLS